MGSATNERLRRCKLAVAALAVCILAGTWPAPATSAQPAQHSFAEIVAQLSEPGGYFDTDNLISNERSYLQVIPQLEQKGVTGGVYIGVGPDQNFSYIARMHPSAAFIVDIRRDNLLLHLLFKGLFAISQTRAEYLSLLTGRPPPDPAAGWRDASLERIIAYVDGAKASAGPALERKLDDTIRSFGVPLSSADMDTIRRFHSEFINAGLSLRFNTFGRDPQSYDPSYRDLLLATDGEGRHLCYLASESDFQFVRSLEARDRVIPVVADVAGPHALAAIGQWMAAQHEQLSAFYISNVEDYLFRNDSFEKYMENLSWLPHNDRSVIIRSVFGRFGGPAVGARRNPAAGSVSSVQSMDELLAGFAAGKYPTYFDLVHP